MKREIWEKYFKTNRMLLAVLAYGIFYFCTFFWLEQRDVSIHMIQTRIDEKIPFCEYFIVPYFFWFAYMAFSIIYFVFFGKEGREGKRMLYSMGTGMTVFLLVSLLYPNGHNLRPVITGESIFLWGVRLLHQIDTATNILPSLHVFCTVVCSISLLRGHPWKKYRQFTLGVKLCTVLIIASTMFLKQHSVVDVVLALLLNMVCYVFFYKIYGKEEENGTCGEEKKYLRSRTC